MSHIPLEISTGASTIDATLQAIVGAFEHAFPNRIRAYYLIGSYAENTAVPLSDLDCCVIFQHHFASQQEHIDAQQLGQHCAHLSPVRLDLSTFPEARLDQLTPFFQVALKLGSQLVYGVDIRAALPLPAFPVYTADVTTAAHYFIARLRGQMHLTTSAVTYPDATQEFFGYTQKSIAAWYPSTIPAGTKELVATVSRIATAMLVRHVQQYVSGKQQAITLFQQHVSGPWASFVTEVFERCKHDWQYRVPEGPHERRELRTLCQRMLAFENMFLQLCPVDTQAHP